MDIFIRFSQMFYAIYFNEREGDLDLFQTLHYVHAKFDV